MHLCMDMNASDPRIFLPQRVRDHDPAIELELARALAACRECVEAHLPRMDREQARVDDSIREAVAAFGTLSRRRGVSPEHVLVMFKSTIREVTTAERWNSMDNDALTGVLVPTLIEAYYSARRATD